MGTSASEDDKTPIAIPRGRSFERAFDRSFAHSAPLPPPYQLAIEDMPFQMTVLEDNVARDYDRDRALVQASWFSATLGAATQKRYLYLVQKETQTEVVVLLLLYDRSALAEDLGGLRLPPSGAWVRAVVDGMVHVLASDLVLTRKSIAAWIGGHEPPYM
jgi:hypothetical protein